MGQKDKMAQAKSPRGAKHRATNRKRNAKVGTFKDRIALAPSRSGPYRTMYALVDTGSIYTWVPGRILRELGIAPTDQYEFVMANGGRVRRDRGEAVVRIDDRDFHTICVFGEDSDQVLLGAVTLEQFALAVDPVKKRLIPMPELPAAESESEGGEP